MKQISPEAQEQRDLVKEFCRLMKKKLKIAKNEELKHLSHMQEMVFILRKRKDHMHFKSVICGFLVEFYDQGLV